MAGAYIRGMGLSCALGEDTDTCVSAMQRMQIKKTTVRLSELNEPLELPYYRIPDRAGLFDSDRYERLLQPVLREAVEQAGLAAEEIRRLPLFIGSLCFFIRPKSSLSLVRTKRSSFLAMSMMSSSSIL